MNLVLRAFNTFTEVLARAFNLLKDVLKIIAKKLPFLRFVIKLGEFLMSLAGKIKTAINKAALTFLYTFERIHEVFFRIVGFTRDNAHNSNVTYEGLMAEHRKEYDIEAVNMLRKEKNYSTAKSKYEQENSWKYGSRGDAGKIFDQSISHDQKSIRVPGVMSREEIDLGGFFTTNSIGFFDTQTAGGSLLNKLLKKIGVGFGAWLSPTDVNVAYELEYGTRKKIYQDVKVGNRSRRWDHELWQVDRDREIRRQYFMIPEGRRVEYQEIRNSTETYMRQTSLKGSSVPQRRIAAAFEYLLEREDTEKEDYGYGKGSYAEKEQQTQEFFRTYTDEVFDVPISSWASPVNSHATKEDIAEANNWTKIDRTGITGEKFEGVRVRGMLGLKKSVDDLTDQEKESVIKGSEMYDSDDDDNYHLLSPGDVRILSHDFQDSILADVYEFVFNKYPGTWLISAKHWLHGLSENGSTLNIQESSNNNHWVEYRSRGQAKAMPTLGARQDNQAGENEALGFMGDIFNSGRKVYANRLEDLIDKEFATASKTKIPKYDILLDSHQRWKDNRIRTGKSNIRAAGTILGTINPFQELTIGIRQIIRISRYRWPTFKKGLCENDLEPFTRTKKSFSNSSNFKSC